MHRRRGRPRWARRAHRPPASRQSKFGAELDSLSDNIAFGTAPALILFLWSLQAAPRFGWIAALALAVCCALRLARFNARIDADAQPHKSAGFNTGVPAPVGAGLAFVPIYLWLITGNELFRSWQLVMPWTLFIAVLMISSVPTYTWASIRIRRGWRLFALAGVALLGAALLNEPWITLLAISLVYLALLPFSIASYARVKRRRASAAAPAPVGAPIRPAAEAHADRASRLRRLEATIELALQARQASWRPSRRSFEREHATTTRSARKARVASGANMTVPYRSSPNPEHSFKFRNGALNLCSATMFLQCSTPVKQIRSAYVLIGAAAKRLICRGFIG